MAYMQGKQLVTRMAAAVSFIPKDAQVATLTTDKAGNASVSGLYPGKYYVKEITPPAGYVLDEEEHDVEGGYEGDQVKEIDCTITVAENVKNSRSS